MPLTPRRPGDFGTRPGMEYARREDDDDNGGAGGNGPAGTNPCAHGGTLGKQVKGTDGKWHLLTPCPTGTQATTANDGRIWCCNKPGDEEFDLKCFKIPGAPGAKGECIKVAKGMGDEECADKAIGDICGGTDPTKFCEGGYLGKQVKGTDGKWHLLTPCKSGFFPETNPDTEKIWCCPQAGKDCVTDADCAEDESCIDGKCVKKEEGCEGGYRLPSGQSRCEKEGFHIEVIADKAWCCPEKKEEECPEGYKLPYGPPPPPEPNGPPPEVVGAGGITEPEPGMPPLEGGCKEGWTKKKIGDEWWCCKIGEKCEGGSLLSEIGMTGGAAGTRPTPEVCPDCVRNPGWEAHWAWSPSQGKFVFVDGTKTTDRVCPKGMVTKGAWCCPEDGGNGDGPGGEFKWSESLQALLARIMERVNYLLDYPRGLTPEERQGVINYAIEGVKRGERGRLQASEDELARMGLAGSGFQLQEAGKIRRGTREMAGDVRREMAVDELNRRFQELTATTGMSGDLTRLLMGSEQIPEVLSSARRQEGQFGISALLNYLAQLQGGGAGGGYWQAILAQLMGGGGGGAGGGMMDWLPWIFSLMDQGGGRERKSLGL